MNREAMLRKLSESDHEWDVIIIGGGATGLGAAVDSASREYDTLLLEQSDFVKATSSRSTKLIHGGVRYLQRGNVSLVREALRERGYLLRNAPHIVRSMEFIIPVYKWWQTGFYGAGLKTYDALAGKLRIGRTSIIDRNITSQRVSTLRTEELRGGVSYVDGQFDDARLGINLARTFVNFGGTALNYFKVTGLLKNKGQVSGVRAMDLESGTEYELRSKSVINATGVFADSIRHMDDPESRSTIAPSQGVHIVLPKEYLPGNSAIMIPRTEDGRVLFAIPWHDRVIIGTTDTAIREASLEPRALPQEIDFVLNHTRKYISRDVSESDVLSMFAGLRPLIRAKDGQSTRTLSRDHTILISDSNLVTITGGKWTTYRRMAEDTISEAARVAGLPARDCRTRNLRIHGWVEQSDEDGHWKLYGADARHIRSLMAQDSYWSQLLHPDMPYVGAEVVWAVRYEMARTLEDVLARRMRALFLNARAAIEVAPRTAVLMAKALGKDERWQRENIAAFNEIASGYILS